MEVVRLIHSTVNHVAEPKWNFEHEIMEIPTMTKNPSLIHSSVATYVLLVLTPFTCNVGRMVQGESKTLEFDVEDLCCI